MEFFAKAHVVKNRSSSSHKDHKSEEKMKKQLKQMLHGYKQRNSDLIKNLVPEDTDEDDSSSVSGFSDLELTDSSYNGRNDSQETVSPKMNVSGFNETYFDHQLNETDNNKEEYDENDSPSITVEESISEYNDNNKSLSGDILLDSQLDQSCSIDDLSLNSSLLQTCSDSETDSESFDNDGTLAYKIKEKLKEMAKDCKEDKNTKNKEKKKKKKKSKRRKLDKGDDGDEVGNETTYRGPYKPKSPENMTMDVDEEDSEDSTKVIFKYRGPLRPKNLENDYSSDEEIYYNPADFTHENSNSPSDLNKSPDFISVTANDMPSQSFDEILGEYKYPTVKNLPCESHDIIQSTSNSGVFTTEDLSFSKVVTEEDTDSLVPEVADDIAVEDIDLEDTSSKILLEAITNEPADDTDLDTSNQVLNDSELLSSTQLIKEANISDDILSTGQDSDKEMSSDSADTTFINPVKIYYGKSCCIFVLKHPTDIYIHGKVRVKCLGGTVEVLGYTLKDRFYEIYAPNYNYAQYLRTVENDNAYYGLFGKLTASGLLVSEAEEIVTSIGDYDGIICLQPLKKRNIDFVDKYFTAGDLFSKSNKSGQCFHKASEKLSCSLYLTMPWRSFSLHPSWKQVVQAGSVNESRGIICGGKGVGKSTFLRYYINKRLAQGPVLLIDLDPGQCELTVAGNVSATVISEPLLGPNFTHLKTPDIMLNLGMINTMDNPKRYAKAVELLITHCANDDRLSKLPWIVNTMGMCNGMGLKFMSLIILHLKPTFLLQIDGKNPKQRFESFLRAETIKELYNRKFKDNKWFSSIENVDDLNYLFVFSHRNESLVKNNFSLASRDERYLNFLAYFGELANGHNDSLLGIVPYEVNLKELNIGANVKLNRDDIAKVINGKIVALCKQADGKGVFTLGDQPLRCYGHGLIRGIDWEKEVAYVLSPVSGAALAEVNTLVYADWAPEVRGQEACAPAETAVPYRTATRYHHRQLMFPPKRRFNPLQLLKMRTA